MSRNPVEAAAVAVLAFIALFVLQGLAPLNYFPKRFKLRTLLIATTLVALALGVIAYSVRH